MRLVNFALFCFGILGLRSLELQVDACVPHAANLGHHWLNPRLYGRLLSLALGRFYVLLVLQVMQVLLHHQGDNLMPWCASLLRRVDRGVIGFVSLSNGLARIVALIVLEAGLVSDGVRWLYFCGHAQEVPIGSWSEDVCLLIENSAHLLAAM